MRKIFNNLSNRVHYTLLAMVFVILLGIGVYALASGTDTSQGYHESDQISVSVSGTEKTLQEAIDDKSLGGSIPSGAVMAFNLASCPSGWSEYVLAYGRFIRGVDKSGTNIDTDGERTLGNIQEDEFESHQHFQNEMICNNAIDGVDSTTTHSGEHHNEYRGTSFVGGSETRPKNVALLYCVKD